MCPWFSAPSHPPGSALCQPATGQKIFWWLQLNNEQNQIMKCQLLLFPDIWNSVVSQPKAYPNFIANKYILQKLVRHLIPLIIKLVSTVPLHSSESRFQSCILKQPFPNFSPPLPVHLTTRRLSQPNLFASLYKSFAFRFTWAMQANKTLMIIILTMEDF